MTEEQAPTSPPKKDKLKLPKLSGGLSTRIKSAIIMAALAMVVLSIGGVFFTVAVALCAAYSVGEWADMTLSDKTVHDRLRPMGMLFAGLAVFISGFVDNPAMTLWILFAFCFFLFSFNLSKNGPNINEFVSGIIYICFALEVMVWLRNVPPHGMHAVMTLLVIVWASDISAYFSGKTIGGPKLAPAISPNKTWAGFIGSSVGAAMAAGIMASTPVLAMFDASTMGGISSFSYVVIGFFLAMLGQAGDLFMSLVKRHYGLKDTGNIIPGHGGLLDRIDALLLVTIVFGSITSIFY